MHSMATSNRFFIWLVYGNSNQNHPIARVDTGGPSHNVTTSSNGGRPPSTYGSYENVDPTVDLNLDFDEALSQHFDALSEPVVDDIPPPNDLPTSSNVHPANANAPSNALCQLQVMSFLQMQMPH
ncbi:hypothetical protein GIB67_005112, partial [Kingdonia uniflora]